MAPRRLAEKTVSEVLHPALIDHLERRAKSAQNRLADKITSLAGSMIFVYVHIAWFGVWILFKVEHYPFGLLTMIVSLEAIFLSTFVMISQNRADERRRVLADHQWTLVQEEEKQNEELIQISREIHDMIKTIHQATVAENKR